MWLTGGEPDPPTMKTSLLFLTSVALLLATLPIARSAATESSVQLRVELDRGVLPAGSIEKAVVKVALTSERGPGPEARPPVNLALVIDCSGSMNNDHKIESARRAALEVLDRLAAGDIVSVVTFGGDVRTVVPARRVGDGREVAAAIRAIHADGETPLFAGVSQGASEVRKKLDRPGYVARILLVSDGVANVGPSSPDELGRLGAALMKEGIAVTTVGLGWDYNEDLMTKLAQRSDGNTYFAQTAEELPHIFGAELGDVLNVVARRVVVSVVFPDGVRPVGFVGREGTIDGQTAEVTMSQLYGGQEKFALVEVEVSPGGAGTGREMARATATFQDAGTEHEVTLTMRATARFSNDHDAVVRSANAKVQSDYAANAIAVAKDRAVALADAGRRAEAAAVLRAQARELDTMGNSYHNSVVLTISGANLIEADRLGRDGLDNATRKDYRTDGANTYNQQTNGRQGP